MKHPQGRKKRIRRQQKAEHVRRPVEPVLADYRQGLTREEVSERMARGWDNHAVDSSLKSTGDIIRENICTYFNLIFILLAVLLCVVRSFRDLTFLPIIIVNTMIGIIQEVHAKNELEKMNVLNATKATVVREGKTGAVPTEKLVRDDIVLFRAGNQICADAEVIRGEVRVNEALLTGETDEIVKECGDSLISGSHIVSGECYARLTGVGEDSYISKLTLEAKSMKKGEQSEMIRALNRLLIFVGIVLIPIGIVLFWQGYTYNHESFADSVTSMVAALIGMIPEGLYLLASVALAVSAVRLAQRRVLLHDMKSIETLARVDVLCVDKTGTITENRMQVKDLIAVNGFDAEKQGELDGILGDFAAAMSNDNATMAAIKEAFAQGAGKRPVKVIPFSSTVKYSGVTFAEEAYVLGAPEYILRDDFAEYQEEIESYTARGYRVLVLAGYEGEITGEPLTDKAVPLGYVLLSNPIRKEAPETFAYFAKQGVEIKVISGDNPLTVAEAAKEAGVVGAENYVDARTLVTKEDIDRAVREYTVFGRVTPAQKRQFVRALKGQGRTVAMTGDGVNDVLALKDADCSIAMASGSEAAEQVAQVVLLDSDFSCMPEVVMEGRRVVNNIQRSASLFLVKNIFSFLMSLFSAALIITYPLEPAQVSLISLFTIGIPAFFLALQPNKNEIKGHFLPNVFVKALPAGLTDFIAVGALVIFGQVFGVAENDISTAATMLLAIVGFMVLLKIASPMNRTKWGIWFGCIGGLLFSSIFFPNLFAITGMSVKCIMLFVVFSIATEPVLRLLTWCVERLREMYRNVRNTKMRKGRRGGRK